MSNLMVIFERYLDPDSLRLRIGGVVTRNVAHSQGVPHGAVQVAIVIQKKINEKLEPHILLQKRSRHKKINPNTWDICGGHVDANREIFFGSDAPSSYMQEGDKSAAFLHSLNLRWQDPKFIDSVFVETALRETNEK